MQRVRVLMVFVPRRNSTDLRSRRVPSHAGLWESGVQRSREAKHYDTGKIMQCIGISTLFPWVQCANINHRCSNCLTAKSQAFLHYVLASNWACSILLTSPSSHILVLKLDLLRNPFRLTSLLCLQQRSSEYCDTKGRINRESWGSYTHKRHCGRRY